MILIIIRSVQQELFKHFPPSKSTTREFNELLNLRKFLIRRLLLRHRINYYF